MMKMLLFGIPYHTNSAIPDSRRVFYQLSSTKIFEITRLPKGTTRPILLLSSNKGREMNNSSRSRKS